MYEDLLRGALKAMLAFYAGEPELIQHFVKVHAFAAMIADKEITDERERFTLETAAYMHDIGILPAMEKYGDASGPLQEKEGPAPAEKILTELNYPSDVMHRVVYLIAHHHTYNNIDGLDYQILVEADFLVNLFERGSSKETAQNVRRRIFKTSAGIELINTMYGI